MGEYTPRPLALQLLIGGGGVALGAYCVKAAYCVGAEADIMIGIALASLVVVSWGMLPWADVRVREGARVEAQAWRLMWLVVLGVVVANGVAYSAHYRVEQTGGAEVRIEAYEDAKRRLATAEAELASLKTNARWDATKGCSNATAEASKEFCGKVGVVKAEIAAAAAIKSSGRPASSDAGVETIAWVTGWNQRDVSRSIPISWALVSDLIASLCLKSVLSAPKRRRREEEEKAEIAAGATIEIVPLAKATGAGAPVKLMPLAQVKPAAALANRRWEAVRAAKDRQKDTVAA
jgi:hypothetical protein